MPKDPQLARPPAAWVFPDQAQGTWVKKPLRWSHPQPTATSWEAKEPKLPRKAAPKSLAHKNCKNDYYFCKLLRFWAICYSTVTGIALNLYINVKGRLSSLYIAFRERTLNVFPRIWIFHRGSTYSCFQLNTRNLMVSSAITSYISSRLLLAQENTIWFDSFILHLTPSCENKKCYLFSYSQFISSSLTCWSKPLYLLFLWLNILL